MQSFDEGTGGELTMASFSIDQLDTPAWHPPAGSELIPWLEANFTFPPDYLPSETNMEVDGVEAVRIYSPSSQQAPSSEEIYFIHDGKLFAIRLLDVDLDVNRQLYDNIIRTFQFE